MNQNFNIQWGRNVSAVLLLAIACLGVGFCASGCKTTPHENCFVTHPVLPLLAFKTFVTGGQVPILDARDPQSFAAGHVPRARNLPPGADFHAKYVKLKKILARHKKDLVIVYCGDQWCSLADELQMQLIGQGFQHVARFPGGWTEWQQAKLPEGQGNAKAPR
jgi:rhodanese-related sulfurtransferase